MPTATSRRTYIFPPMTLRQLEALAKRHECREGVIIRDAVAVYAYIDEQREKAQKNGQTLTVLLDRGDGKASELLIPGLSQGSPQLVPV